MVTSLSGAVDYMAGHGAPARSINSRRVAAEVAAISAQLVRLCLRVSAPQSFSHCDVIFSYLPGYRLALRSLTINRRSAIFALRGDFHV